MNRSVLIAIVMFVISGVLAVGAVVIVWNGYQRITGMYTLREATTTLANGTDLAHGRHLADQAAAALPREPAAVMIDLDFSDPASDTVLAHLGEVCQPRYAQTIDTARQFGHVLRHEPAVLSHPEDPDQALLTAILAMRTGAVGGPLPSGTPHLAVLELYYIEQLPVALAHRDSATAVADTGALATLMPLHPQALLAQVIAMALVPDFDGAAETRLAQMVIQHAGQANVVGPLLELSMLLPDRAQALLNAGLRLGVSTAMPVTLQALVQAAHSGQADPLHTVQVCLDNNQAGLTKDLLPMLPEQLRDTYGRALHISSGDMVTMAALGSQDARLLPRCSPPQVHRGLLCFHVSNALGSLPISGVVIKLNGATVQEKDLHRIGTLFGVKPTAHGQVLVEIQVGALTLYDDTVAL